MSPKKDRGGRGGPRGKPRGAKRSRYREPTKCRFCRAKAPGVDYKDLQSLQRLTSREGGLFGRKRSGNCARHQRMVRRAVKRARFIALLPYV